MLPLSYAAAEGYQVNAQSSKQSGMGHVGAAMKLGAESMHFNPAGLGFMTSNVDLSAGVAGVFPSAEYSKGDYTHKADNKASTPMYLYAGFKVIDNLYAGISLTNPYGSAINWGKNWAGAGLVQDISLKSFSIQPTVSYKILDRLSVGAGLMVAFGDFSLSRALVPAGALNGYGVLANLVDVLPAPYKAQAQEVLSDIPAFKDSPAASATLSGNAGVRMGFNIGAMFDINEKFTIGVSYRSKMMMKVNEGTAVMDYANKSKLDGMIANVASLKPVVDGILEASGSEQRLPALGIPPLDKGTFVAELPMPSNLNVGLTFKPNQRLTLSGEVQFVGWGAYETLNVQFSQEGLAFYNIDAEKNYKNTRIYRIGGQFAATDRLDVRLGAYFDESPVKDDYLNPETPSMNKLGLTTGLSFRPMKSFSIDFAFSYVTGFGRDGSYTDKLTGKFDGHYKVHAITPSIGLAYAF